MTEWYVQYDEAVESLSQGILLKGILTLMGNLPDNVANINYGISILRMVIYAVIFQNGNLTR